jgi:uncharacterized repeat protein (TIGR04138 family)
MEEKKDFYQLVEEIYSEDSRYNPDAYEFLMQALYFTQKKLARKGHVSGSELSKGLRDFAIEQFGPMAKTVLSHWGITKVEDFGNMVYNMIRKGLLSKTQEDSIEDFKDVYDFQEAFRNVLRDSIIKMAENDHEKDK